MVFEFYLIKHPSRPSSTQPSEMRHKCSSCKKTTYLIDPLSVSVTAERLLYRSKAELENGDYSLSIVIATIAVESYLTRLFLKLKGMENYATTFELPNESMEAQWEKEYPRSGGFLKPSDFVAKQFTGLTFDQFVLSNNTVTAHAFLGLPNPNKILPSRYFQNELFNRRNRIAHWGYVNSTRQEAEHSHQIAVRNHNDLKGDGPFEIFSHLSL